MTREIPLTRGLVALVDDEDYERINARKWYAIVTGSQKKAARSLSRRDGDGCIYMHREIIGAPLGVQVDHINGNALDNRRSNLRLASHQENNFNRRVQGRFGFKGVYANRCRFIARIVRNKRPFYLGTYDTPLEAALAYDAAAKQVFGEFAWLNFPNGHPVPPVAEHSGREQEACQPPGHAG